MLENLVASFNQIPVTAQFLLLAAASLVLAKVFEQLSLKLVRSIVMKRDGELEKLFWKKLHPPVYVTIALVGIFYSLRYVNFLPQTSQLLGNLVLTAAALIWTWAAITIGESFLTYVRETEESRFDYEFAPIFGNMWTAVVLIVSGFGIVSGIWNVDVTPFLASAGILGVIGGFAAKDTISNFFGGLALYFDNTYKLGDFVQLDSGEEGVVVDIGIRSTNLKTRNDMIITVPNSILNSSKVINQSAPNNTGRLDIEVGVSYEEDIEDVEEALLEVAEESDVALESPSPRVRLQRFGDNSMEYELFVWIANPIERVRARHRLNRAVAQKFDEQGIEIPYPQRTLSYASDEGQRPKDFEQSGRDGE